MRTLYVVCCTSLLACGTETIYVYPDTGTTDGVAVRDQALDHTAPPLDTQPGTPDHKLIDHKVLFDTQPPPPDSKPPKPDTKLPPPPDQGPPPPDQQLPPDQSVPFITKCIPTSFAIGKPCDDGNPCTHSDTCQPGPKCVGVPYSCLPACAMQCTGETTPTGAGECAPRAAILGNYCYIDGSCYANGTPRWGQPCEKCNVLKSTTAWSYAVTGPLGGACTTDAQCAAPTTCHLGHCTCYCPSSAFCQNDSPSTVCHNLSSSGWFCNNLNWP